MSTKIFEIVEPLKLESGVLLPKVKIAYTTYGKLNTDISNVIWVFHALTANSDVMDWWPGLFGEREIFSPKDQFIICANVLGSEYGSSQPENLDFPQFTVRDVVKTHLLLAESLGINKINVAIGGSFGGSQALEFAYSFPGKINNLILVACAASESAWGIAIHEAQRLALKADASFGLPGGGGAGLTAARAIGMLTYRTADAFIAQQTDDDDRTDNFSAASYIRYQGEKLRNRFNALSYYYLSKCLDSHHIGRNRGGITQALSVISIKTLVIGIDSDQLLPIALQKQLARFIPNAEYKEVHSGHGHDGFLIETKQLSALFKDFLHNTEVKEISCDGLKSLIDNNEDIQLIDVREAHEVKAFSIGGLHIPLAELPHQLEKVATGKKVIIYCRSGRRSGLAVEYLQKLIDNNQLYNLTGGMITWAKKFDKAEKSINSSWSLNALIPSKISGTLK